MAEKARREADGLDTTCIHILLMAYIRFGLFRRITTGLFALSHVVSMALALFIRRLFVSEKTLCILGVFELIIIALLTASAVIKPLLRISHSVAEEVFSSFAVFVLSTALSLFAASAEVKPDEVSNPRLNFAMIFWIRVIVISMFTHFGCTIFLSLVSLLTYFAFDPNVWILDIDASPSPFPAPILLAFTFPCLHSLFPPPRGFNFSLTDDDGNSPNPNRQACFTHDLCNCPPKPATLQSQDLLYLSVAISDDNATTPNTGTARHTKKVSASKLLIQVPDAAQRRMSCSVSFVHAQAEDEV